MLDVSNKLKAIFASLVLCLKSKVKDSLNYSSYCNLDTVQTLIITLLSKSKSKVASKADSNYSDNNYLNY